MRNIRLGLGHFTHFLCFFALCLLVLTSCERSTAPEGPISVRIPGGTEGELRWTTRELTSLQDLRSLTGSAARFLVKAQLDQNGQLRGDAPRLQVFKNSRQEYIAKDEVSLQFLSLYAHLEDLQKRDNELGIGTLLSWPRNVAVQFKFNQEGGLFSNNAMYSGEIDALIFVPYTDSGLPLTVNGGVVAHEHFHAIFYQLFSAPLKSVDMYPTDKYHEVLMRGLNEGLADVWGWLFTKDELFISKSLNSAKSTRRVDIPVRKMSTQVEVQKWARLLDEEGRLSYSYSLGNQYARAIVDLVQRAQVSDKDLSMALLNSVRELQLKVMKLGPSQVLPPESLLESLQANLKNTYPESCLILKQMYLDDQKAVEQCSK